jgi:hypothetical protein
MYVNYVLSVLVSSCLSSFPAFQYLNSKGILVWCPRVRPRVPCPCCKWVLSMPFRLYSFVSEKKLGSLVHGTAHCISCFTLDNNVNSSLHIWNNFSLQSELFTIFSSILVSTSDTNLEENRRNALQIHRTCRTNLHCIRVSSFSTSLLKYQSALLYCNWWICDEG